MHQLIILLGSHGQANIGSMDHVAGSFGLWCGTDTGSVDIDPSSSDRPISVPDSLTLGIIN